jgi:stress response protein YsnF
MSSQQQHVLGNHREHRGTEARQEESGAIVQLHQEELAARKQAVEAGRVSLGTELVQEQQTLQVPVTHEEVTTDRQAIVYDEITVGKYAAQGDVHMSGEAA